MRLQFGNPDHIQLLEQAQELVREYESLSVINARRFRRRIHWQAKGTCCLCSERLLRDEQFIQLGKREVHDRCLVTRLVELRRKLTTLGYRINPVGGGCIIERIQREGIAA